MDEVITEKLKECLLDIRQNPKVKGYSEADTKLQIVLRILGSLNWNLYGDDIRPEYAVENGKVDYALQIKGQNKVFVEVKNPQESVSNPNHQKQLLQYSFLGGVKLAVLTNGVSWSFYLPMRPVELQKRWFNTITINVSGQEIEEIVNGFISLLARERVGTGEAEKTAESMWEDRQRNLKIQESLPMAWNRILKDPDSLLVDLLEESVEKMCGIKPESDEIREFILLQHSNWNFPSTEKHELKSKSKKDHTKPSIVKQEVSKGSTKPQIINDFPYLIINGNQFKYKFAKDVLTIVADWLIDQGHIDPAECPFNVLNSKKRYLVNHSPIHPGGNGFFNAEKLKNGLYIETHAEADRLQKQAICLLQRYGYPKGSLKVFTK